MAAYNCPDNVSASDPEAPWNQTERGTGLCWWCGDPTSDIDPSSKDDAPFRYLCKPCAKAQDEAGD
jgi:hypothetical protein